LPAAQAVGMVIDHPPMPKTKVALTLDSELLEQVDALVHRRRFRSRSQAIEVVCAIGGCDPDQLSAIDDALRVWLEL
jgi:hypothetical protein